MRSALRLISPQGYQGPTSDSQAFQDASHPIVVLVLRNASVPWGDIVWGQRRM